MHSPQHRTASVISFLSIPQAPLIQSVITQALFQPSTNGMFYFLRRVSPNERILLVLIMNGFFFQKDSKRQIQQGFFEYNIYRQKNKKSSKDKAANTDPSFGQ